MQIGTFNMSDYINKLNESEDGNIDASDKDGLIIPDENKKAFDWLKKEYNANQVETKVEIKNGKDKIENKDEFVAKDDTNKDFKTGQFSTDQKNDGDGSKSDFKPFGEKSETTKEEKSDTEKTATETKKKVSVKGITPKTKSLSKPPVKKETKESKEEDKEKEDKD